MYFELSDDFPPVVLPPIQPPNPPDTNITITPIDVPWDFRVNRNQRGLPLSGKMNRLQITILSLFREF